MTKILSFGHSILQPWWTWGRSSTSMGSCKKLKPITSEHSNWNRMTPSLSPTCVSCGISWRNRAWGPQVPELTLPAYLPSVHQTWGKGWPTRSSCTLVIRKRMEETQGGCLLREAITVPHSPPNNSWALRTPQASHFPQWHRSLWLELHGIWTHENFLQN